MSKKSSQNPHLMEHPTGFGTSIGFQMVTMEPGHAIMSIDVRPELYNPVNVLHGGVVYSLVDESMGAALTAALSKGQICATIEIKIHYLEAVRDGKLTVETNIIKKGKRVAHMKSDVTHHPSGKKIATAMGSFSIFTPSGRKIS